MMKCGNVLELIALYDDDVLSDEERAKVDVHLENCEGCREALDDFRDIAMILADLPPVEPPAELKAKVYRNLQEEIKSSMMNPPAAKHKKNHKVPFWLGSMVASVVLVVAFANAEGYFKPLFNIAQPDKLVATTAAVGAAGSQNQGLAATQVANGKNVKKTKDMTVSIKQNTAIDSQSAAMRTSAHGRQERQDELQNINHVLSRNGISKPEHISSSPAMMSADNATGGSQTQVMKRNTMPAGSIPPTAPERTVMRVAAAQNVILPVFTVSGVRCVSLNEASEALGFNCDIKEGGIVQPIVLSENGKSIPLEGTWQDGMCMVQPEKLADVLHLTLSFDDAKAVFHKQ